MSAVVAIVAAVVVVVVGTSEDIDCIFPAMFYCIWMCRNKSFNLAAQTLNGYLSKNGGMT